MKGMLFTERHPELAFRDCGHCQRFIYNEETGEPLLSNGKLTPRPATVPPYCRTKRGCLKGTPESPNTLPDFMAHTVEFYRIRLACGAVPNEPLAQEIATLVHRIDRLMQRERMETGLAARLATILMPMMFPPQLRVPK